MQESEITFIINGKSYRLSAKNQEAIRHIPKQDREQLIALLESVKQQDRQAAVAVQQAAARVGVVSSVAGNNNVGADSVNNPPIKPERLGKGDVDDLMARLIMEEKRNKKPGITQQTIYKWAAVIIAVIFILVMIS